MPLQPYYLILVVPQWNKDSTLSKLQAEVLSSIPPIIKSLLALKKLPVLEGDEVIPQRDLIFYTWDFPVESKRVREHFLEWDTKRITDEDKIIGEAISWHVKVTSELSTGVSFIANLHGVPVFVEALGSNEPLMYQSALGRDLTLHTLDSSMLSLRPIEDTWEFDKTIGDLCGIRNAMINIQAGGDMKDWDSWVQEGNPQLYTQFLRKPEKLYSISPKAFEGLIGGLLTVMGFNVTPTVTKVGDGGFDLDAIHRDSQQRVLVECKRYNTTQKIGVGWVRKLYGVLKSEQADKAYLVTTSSFTQPAKDFIAAHTPSIIGLDFENVLDLIRKHFDDEKQYEGFRLPE